MSAIRDDGKFASHVKKEGKAIGAELGEEELKQVIGGSLFSGRIEWTYWRQKADG
jgi:bacteriocin-like protein